MQKAITLVMYFLWTVTILAILATTFMDFKYEDLNMLAGIALLFAVMNSYLAFTMKKRAGQA